MKIKKWSGLLGIIAMMLVAAHAHAGEKGGNGGNVLKTPNGLRVLDLVEAGVSDDRELRDTDPNAALLKQVELVFSGLRQVGSPERRELAAVLHRMPLLQAYALLAGARAYSWNFVDRPLTQIDDIDSSLDYPPQDRIQAAARHGYAIEVSLAVWKKLDALNRAALILHEVLYAYVVPQNGEQSSVLARQMVGGIFSGRFTDLTHYRTDPNPEIQYMMPPSYGSGAVITYGIHPIDAQPMEAGIKVQADGTPYFWLGGELQINGHSLDVRSAWPQTSSATADLVQSTCRECVWKTPADWYDPHCSIDLGVQYYTFVVKFGEYQSPEGTKVFLEPQTATKETPRGASFHKENGKLFQGAVEACESELTSWLQGESQQLLNELSK